MAVVDIRQIFYHALVFIYLEGKGILICFLTFYRHTYFTFPLNPFIWLY